jgi:cyclopropane-fatty-acyl-phospholipid synthase
LERRAGSAAKKDFLVNLETYLNGLIKHGTLEVALPGGKRFTFGDGSPPHVAATLRGATTMARIVADPSLGVGEAYMDGRLILDQGTLHDLLDLASKNSGGRPGRRRPGLLRRRWLALKRERNDLLSARRNVAHHYDLSSDFYRLFLDEDMQYSCAYFERPGMSLEDAQLAKKRHIAAKLNVRAGQSVLDIGCGWGGMALSVASWTGARVDGVTLSTEQLQTARRRADAAGLAGRANFFLTDYRDVTKVYDRIVSVGMFEHVGRPNYQAFFDAIAARLADDGVAVIHSIGRWDGPSVTDGFTAKYIFPGGYIPAFSEVTPAIERSGLLVTDIEILRLHYADTLRCWLDRFMARRSEVLALYDEPFCRMWEFYLAGAEMSFRYGAHMNFQIQLTKNRHALPLTRTYMELNEKAMRIDGRRAA